MTTAYDRFADHVVACRRCREVRLDKPASLAKACLDGSRLAKDAYAAGRASIEKGRRDAAAGELAGAAIAKARAS